jgi:hypothetical protein
MIRLMAVELIKSGARIQDSLIIHHGKIICDYCNIRYELHYSKGEEHHLNTWLLKAKPAVSKSHANNHPNTVAVPL